MDAKKVRNRWRQWFVQGLFARALGAKGGRRELVAGAPEAPLLEDGFRKNLSVMAAAVTCAASAQAGMAGPAAGAAPAHMAPGVAPGVVLFLLLRQGRIYSFLSVDGYHYRFAPFYDRVRKKSQTLKFSTWQLNTLNVAIPGKPVFTLQ